MPNRILIVEDDAGLARVLSDNLRIDGFEVSWTATGDDAPPAARAFQPDLILLDVMLPYIDGFEIVRLVRERADWAAVPVLMLTAKNTERDTVRALDAGANDFVIKPFQPNELLARVRRFLRPAA